MSNCGAVSLTSGEAFDVLGDAHRRQLVMTLRDDNLEDETAIPESVTTDDKELEAMLIEMTHIHLPKLESLDISEWHREENVVTRGPEFEVLRPLLELIDRHQDELPGGWL